MQLACRLSLRVLERCSGAPTGGRKVAGKIHRVMQQAEYLDESIFTDAQGAENDEMSALPLIAGDVQRHQVATDVLTAPYANGFGAAGERFNGGTQCSRVCLCLKFAKMSCRPTYDLPEVGFGSGG